MDKVYKCVVTQIDPETNEEEVVLDDTYTGMTILADCVEKGRMAEVVLHDNIAGIATKMLSGGKTAVAVRLANCLMDMKDRENESKESALMRAIMGDICDE